MNTLYFGDNLEVVGIIKELIKKFVKKGGDN